MNQDRTGGGEGERAGKCSHRGVGELKKVLGELLSPPPKFLEGLLGREGWERFGGWPEEAGMGAAGEIAEEEAEVASACCCCCCMALVFSSRLSCYSTPALCSGGGEDCSGEERMSSVRSRVEQRSVGQRNNLGRMSSLFFVLPDFRLSLSQSRRREGKGWQTKGRTEDFLLRAFLGWMNEGAEWRRSGGKSSMAAVNSPIQVVNRECYSSCPALGRNFPTDES